MDKVVHFEIPVDDFARAKKFYQSVFGWKTQDMPGEMPYTIVRTTAIDDKFMPLETGAINGGLTERSVLKAPTVTISVKSIDDYIEKVKTNGGNVVTTRKPVMGMGFYAYISDSEGNTVGLWEDAKK